MFGFRHLWLASGTAIVAALVPFGASGAFAQDAAGTARQEPTALETGSDEPAPSEEIIVTAQRRDQRLVDVPLSITAITRDEIENTGASNLRDLGAMIPNMTFVSSDINAQLHVTVRGISAFTQTAGFDSALGAYVDDIWVGRPDAFNQVLDEVERIEVLRGPQGTLFGKNTAVGAVNFITIRPRDEFEGRVSAEFGDFNLRRYTAMLNVPIAPGDVAMRVSGSAVDRDGYVRNVTRGTRDDLEQRYLRGAVRFTPTNQLTIDVAGDLFRNRSGVYTGDFIDGAFVVPGPRTVAYDFPEFQNQDNSSASVTASYAFATGHQLTSITAFRRSEWRVGVDADGSDQPILAAEVTEAADTYMQELRLTSPSGGAFNYVIGAYADSQRSDSFRDGEAGAGLVPFVADALGVTPGDIETLFPTPARGNFLEDSATITRRSQALFGNLEYHPGDRWTLGGGLRWTHDERSVDFAQDLSPLLASLLSVGTFTRSESFASDELTPLAYVSYQLAPDATVYARYARGFKSGGFNVDTQDENLERLSFRSEYVDNYEVGGHGVFSNGRLYLSGALFYMDYSDLQVPQEDPVTFTETITNAAQATVFGFEGEVALRPVEGLELSGGIGYTHAEFDEFDLPGVGDVSGQPLSEAPRWNANAAIQYTAALLPSLRLITRADVTYRGDFYNGVPADATNRTDEVTLVNLRASLESTWRLSVYVNNLFDVDYSNADFFSANIGASGQRRIYGAPRTIGAELGLTF